MTQLDFDLVERLGRENRDEYIKRTRPIWDTAVERQRERGSVDVVFYCPDRHFWVTPVVISDRSSFRMMIESDIQGECPTCEAGIDGWTLHKEVERPDDIPYVEPV